MAIIDDPSVYWQIKQWTGNDGTSALTFDGNADLQADLFWLKTRNAGDLWRCYDSVRGVNIGLVLNATDAEQNIANDGITAIGSDGFTMVDGSNFGGGNYNQGSTNYIAYAWKELAGFMDIVSYTGNGSNRDIAHNLGAVPKMMIVKERDNANDWKVYHHYVGNGKSLRLDTTAAAGDDSTAWNSTTPTSSVFSVGTSNAVNRNGGDIIAYCFSEVKNYSKISSYIGNGNVNGSYIHLGFSPAFLLIRRVSPGTSWQIQDNKRSNGGQNINEDSMFPDTSGAEGGGKGIDHLANGFKLRSTSGANNSSGHTFIYYAVSEHPFVTSPDNGSVPATAR
jgi:hypothetical protein